MRLAGRVSGIEPFHVMKILERARAMEAQGRSVIHMEIGEPDFPTPEPVIRAGIEALEQGKTHYTPALGLPELRAAIAASYAPDASVDPARVVVTPGASGALQLVFGALVGPGDSVILADPGYPCNRHFVRLFEAEPVAVPVGPEAGYQLTLEAIRQHWRDDTRAVMIASPSNPTGTVVADEEIQAIARFVEERDAVLIVDEIYTRLSYAEHLTSALKWSDHVCVINSFSKYYGMTGWRLGWLVAPPAMLDAIERLAQNLFIASPTPSQYAALVAFAPETLAELERRRQAFEARRNYLLPALKELGFRIEVEPQGAFYLYADCSAFTDDSFGFCEDVLEQTGVALTPGRDFGQFESDRYVRFSYANDIALLQQAVERLRGYLSQGQSLSNPSR